jgi:YHS domain-containing protein
MNRMFSVASIVLAAGAGAAAIGVAGQPAEGQHAQEAPAITAYTIQLGVSGYSPVSYLARNRAEPGSPLHRAEHQGVTYFFTDANQVKAFKAAPDRYLPAYGGYCAFGCSVDSKFVPDPTSFEIIDGRTHLFLKNEEVDARQLWRDADEREARSKADAFWKNANSK